MEALVRELDVVGIRHHGLVPAVEDEVQPPDVGLVRAGQVSPKWGWRLRVGCGGKDGLITSQRISTQNIVLALDEGRRGGEHHPCPQHVVECQG